VPGLPKDPPYPPYQSYQPTMQLLDRIRRTIRDHAMIPSGSHGVAAVSGGSDSVALAHVLKALDASGDLRLVGIAHFNHQLRTAADAEERFVTHVAVGLDVPVFVDRGDVARRAQDERRSTEDAARASRYEFFDRARAHFNADWIALGHTRDDQAETFLLRLLRGAGPRGLAAMYPRHGTIVRPLIECRRLALQEWLVDRDVAFVDDESNADVSIPRNRVRAELLPLLAARFNPAIVDVLADDAALAREAWEIIDAAADEIASRIVKGTDRSRTIEIAELRAVPLALRRAVVWRAMTEIGGARAVGFEHTAAALRLLDGDGPAVLDAPGQKLERIGASLVLTGRPANTAGRSSNSPASAANLFRYSLSIPGEVVLAEAGCAVSANPASGPELPAGSAITGNGVSAFVRGDLCRGRLAIRNRRPGDRFRPVGVGGRKKLQDFFVDRKVRRADRDLVPIVVDENDRIVWVAGYGIDEAFRVTDPAQAVLLLRLRRV
jgi:tRNA(Ile)-lysidine synthase